MISPGKSIYRGNWIGLDRKMRRGSKTEARRSIHINAEIHRGDELSALLV
jgi:hypothetical protein